MTVADDRPWGEAAYQSIANSCMRHCTGPTAHRLFLCIVSISLLWLTSLKVAIFIVSLFFTSPPFSSVHSSCTAAYEEVTSQRLKYEDCVGREMAVCDKELSSVHAAERSRADNVLQNNAIIISKMSERGVNCSSDVAKGSSVLHEWSVAGGTNYIAYLSSCTDGNRAWMQSELSDASEIRSGGMDQLRGYVASVDTAMGRVASHSRQLNNYNIDYVRNHSKDIASATIQVIEESEAAAEESLLRLNAIVDELRRASDHLIDCIGLSNTSSVTARHSCVSGQGVYDLYLQLIRMMQIQKVVLQRNIQEYNTVLNRYTGSVTAAMSAANSFFDSINGARGLTQYLVKDLSLFGSSSELCGKTTPNWCTFSKVL